MTAALFIVIVASLTLGAWFGRAQARVNQQFTSSIRDVLVEREAELDHDANALEIAQ